MYPVTAHHSGRFRVRTVHRSMPERPGQRTVEVPRTESVMRRCKELAVCEGRRSSQRASWLGYYYTSTPGTCSTVINSITKSHGLISASPWPARREMVLFSSAACVKFKLKYPRRLDGLQKRARIWGSPEKSPTIVYTSTSRGGPSQAGS